MSNKHNYKKCTLNFYILKTFVPFVVKSNRAEMLDFFNITKEKKYDPKIQKTV